jgi:hypothetical protein
MMNSTFNELWAEAQEDREEMLALYDTLEYLPRLLTKVEIILVRDLIEAAAPTKTFAEFCSAIGMTTDEVAEKFEIPAEVTLDWEANGIPEYMRKMIACSVASARIEDGRCHTCQGCGEIYVTDDPREVMCPECRHNIGEWLLSQYVSMKMLNAEIEAEEEEDDTESESES